MSKELDIIHLIGTMIPNPSDLQDDAFYDPDSRLIYTTDMLVENRHFSRDYFSPEDIGWKACAVNLSDIASVGGMPKYTLISLGLPDSLDLAFVKGFYTGFNACSQTYNSKLIGGDTVGSDTLVINVTAIGHLPQGHHPGQRHLCQPGDIIITTCFSGLSAVGLYCFQDKTEGFSKSKAAHLRPKPQIELGLSLSKNLPRFGMMDTSDGLADALMKLATQSKVHIEVDAQALTPWIHPEITAYCQKNPMDPMSLVLYGGEDFELMASVPPEYESHLPPEFHKIGIVRSIEAETSEPGVILKNLNRPENGSHEVRLSISKTFQHF
ncbi:MAG: thiamine-phosphate kinase [Cyanobacteria bacterium]|nr:thiamine-phosphate kinase [Cyanobacteriota bacterium]